jgi:hypothetical protein
MAEGRSTDGDEAERGSSAADTGAVDRTRWLRLALGGLPFLGILGGAGFANRTEPYVLGLPFLLAWIVLWVVASSVVLAVVYVLDPANRTPHRPDHPENP